jgi:hypothetical protein
MLYRYKEFLAATKPALVLLLKEKQDAPVLFRDDVSCPLYIMCTVSEQIIPGVGALHRALMGSGCWRMGRPVLDFDTFKNVASTVLADSQNGVDALMRACRSVGSKTVAVDMVEWLLCIHLERSMDQVLAERC